LEGSLSEHIGAAELAKLLEESRQRTDSAWDVVEIHPHLAACTTCRQQFNDLSLLDRQLKNVRRGSAQRRADCPQAAVWHEISTGLTPPDETLTHVEHASRCDYCGPLLRAAIAEFSTLSGEMTEAERARIATLASAQAEWQQALAQQITGASHPTGSHAKASRQLVPWWQGWSSVPRLAMAGAVLIAFVVGVSWLVARRNQPAAAHRLIASAYTQKRTLELRIAGADYAPSRVSLGPTASFTSRPPALLKAEALIASQLLSHPSDASWLQAKAQADLLEGRSAAAAESLRRALELNPNSPALLVDLASADFQRAQQEGRKEDFGSAYESLSRALKINPDDPVALFNRAIVAEHLFLYHQALDDWKHYLQVDSSSQWAAEARSRASDLQEKLKAHESQATPLLSPNQIDGRVTDASLASEIDERIEDYLHEAVGSWLPEAFPDKRAAANPSASQALFFLADLTIRRHGDRWLSDLLQGSKASNFPPSVNAFARAVNANLAGEYDVSLREAARAEKLFRASGNPAGVLRARFEQAYTAQLNRDSETCRQQAASARAESEKHSYPWLQIALGLEEGICSGIMNDLGTEKRMAQRACDRAQEHGYGGLYLRSVYFAADERVGAGDRSAAWSLSLAGLQRYWSGQYPWRQAYNFYGGLTYDVESRGQFHLQVALWREAIAAIGTDAAPLRQAMAHELLAQAAKSDHQPRLAEQQHAEAARLYALAPQTDASRNNAIENQIRRAQLESRQEQLDSALGRLISVQNQVQQLSNDYLVQMFYSTLGEVELDGHRTVDAEQAFQPALRLAEKNLASLSSETERTKWSKDAAPVYLGLAEAQLLQSHQQESLGTFESFLGAPQRAAVGGSANRFSSPDPSNLSGRLPLLSKQTIVAYGVLPDGLAIWVYDNRGISSKWIATSPHDLQDLADRFYAECSDPNSQPSALRRDGQTLYSLLVAPIEAQLDPKRTLAIETEGFLSRLPFEALLDASGHYLIERETIVHSPGLYAEERMHPETTISRDVPALIVSSAASLPEAGLLATPNVLAGADTIASDFHFPSVIAGAEATLGTIAKAMPSAAVFHFAGHAITILDDTGLLIEGKDARTGAPVLLDANTVRHLNLRNMQLAVLAACSTDSGEGGSRGFDSVAQALQTSGVPHVVASRWAVDSADASIFADSFYGDVLAGQPVSAATRRTSQKMLLDPHTAQPYHWAAFAAYGRP
jgi:CHAT domain-containing protein